MLPSATLAPRSGTLRRRVSIGVILLLAILQGCAHDRRTIGSMVDDSAVELKTTGMLTTDPTYKDAHVNVTSVNGILLLSGETPTSEMRDSLLANVRNIPSIRRIVNEVRVAPPSTLSQRSRDAWITGKVKSRLIGTRGLHSSRVTVVTESTSVFLMGLVSQQESELATNAATNVSGIERVVKLFEYVD
jgi:osmotically-inducible protein OsmY